MMKSKRKFRVFAERDWKRKGRKRECGVFVLMNLEINGEFIICFYRC